MSNSIPSNACFKIVEIGQAHDGSLGILHSYIDALAQTGIDAVKFQTHIAEAESSIHEPFRVKFSYVDDTRFDYWKRMSFTAEQWAGIKKHCEDVGLEFISSPFSQAAVDLLESLNVKRYKIASGEVTNLLMLEKIARTGKPMILSSGMSSYEELDHTIQFLSSFGNELAVLQCTTAYPTPPEKTGLNVITELKERYKIPTGLSDHSGEIYPSLAAVALGASIIEVHVAFDKKIFGPDSTSSLTLSQITEMVKGINMIEKSLSNPVNKKDNSSYSELKKIFEKSLAVNKDLPKGHVLTQDDLETKKPSGYGIPASLYKNIIGKKLSTVKSKYDFITQDDIEQ